MLAEDDSTVTEQAWDRLVEEGRIDGILVASAAPGNPILHLVAGSRVPYVFVNRRVPGSGRNIYMRESDAGRMAAEHLIASGTWPWHRSPVRSALTLRAVGLPDS